MSSLFSLARAYEKYFRIGAAVSPASIAKHRGLIRQHFNSLTAENAMKYEPTEPEQGRFRFEGADEVAALAREMGVQIRAHAPVWHNQTPGWMYLDGDRPAAPELICERIDAHSRAMCERYRGDVYAWDVVNEAVRDDPGSGGGTMESVCRDSTYFRLCGPGFMVAAFRSMEKYAGNAQLFYNDYGECLPEKRERIVRLIRYLRDRGCRVDGIGMQQHHFSAPDWDEIRRSIEIYASLGLRIHVTELDISMTAAMNPGTRQLKPEDPGYAEYIREAARASDEKRAGIDEMYIRLFEIYRSYADVIDCVTTWGVADDHTWLDHFGVNRDRPVMKEHPLLFDEQGAAKPCVYRLIADAE